MLPLKCLSIFSLFAKNKFTYLVKKPDEQRQTFTCAVITVLPVTKLVV